MTQTSVSRIENREDFTFTNLDRERIQRILGNVVFDKAFFFYEDIGKPTGDFAVNLFDFCGKINSIASNSLAFHLKRGDFENWVRETIGDTELSQRVKKLRASKTVWKNDASLRTKLHSTVKNRIAELQDLWHQNLKWPEAWPVKP